MRWRRWSLAVLLAGVLTGCPRQTQEPGPGDSAEPCATLADCNLGRTCGEAPLRACVDLQCEAEPSLVIPCRR